MSTNRIDATKREADEEAAARKRLAMLPGFSAARADTARFERLVGMTNRVWKVDTGGEAFCLRLPGSGAAARIDRRIEERNARLAAEAGVAPEVLYFDEDGVMLTRFVGGALPLLPARVNDSAGAIERTAIALSRLHRSGVVFAGNFQAFHTIDSYAAILQRLRAPLSKSEEDGMRTVREIGRALAQNPVPARPCHCDPTGRNLLDTGERVWLVDWEYSGQNDPSWDLAYFSIESRLDPAGDDTLLGAYFGRAPHAMEVARVAVLKPVAEVLAGLWALIQHAEGNPGGNFRDYATGAFARATERMANPDLHRHLKLLDRQGSASLDATQPLP
jgi:thiamine kinase-like enzyme